MMMTNQLSDIPIELKIESIQQGDLALQNELLRTYKPFVAKCVSEVCKRYIDPKKDDEFSIGFAAFNEAIFSYKADKGSSFLSFAKLVVKRKVIDYIRYHQKRPSMLSLDETVDADQMENPLIIAAAKEKYEWKMENVRRREEIEAFKENLKAYRLTLEELTEVSPKHRDARESAIGVAYTLYADQKLRHYVHSKKKLPIKDLLEKVEVSKKTLERNRKFILAIFIVLSNEYVYMKEYLKGVEE